MESCVVSEWQGFIMLFPLKLLMITLTISTDSSIIFHRIAGRSTSPTIIMKAYKLLERHVKFISIEFRNFPVIKTFHVTQCWRLSGILCVFVSVEILSDFPSSIAPWYELLVHSNWLSNICRFSSKFTEHHFVNKYQICVQKCNSSCHMKKKYSKFQIQFMNAFKYFFYYKMKNGKKKS